MPTMISLDLFLTTVSACSWQSTKFDYLSNNYYTVIRNDSTRLKTFYVHKQQ